MTGAAARRGPGPAGDRPPSPGRRARILAAWAAIGLVGGLGTAITAPLIVGGTTLTVLSGSMRPTLTVGDVVLVEEVGPQEVRIGDVISFRDPHDPSRLLTHRVRDIRVEGSAVAFVTKGDANTGVERWRIPSSGGLGRVVWRVPLLGYALHWARGPVGRILLVVVPAVALGLHELWRIWRPAPEEADGAAAA